MYRPHRYFKPDMSYSELRFTCQIFSCRLPLLNGNSVFWLFRPKNKTTTKTPKIPYIHPSFLSFPHLCSICKQILLVLLLKYIQIQPLVIISASTIQVCCGDHYNSFLINGLPASTPDSSVGKESACNAGDPGLIPGSRRSTGEGIGYPLQYSGLENSMDCTVHWVAKSWTWLNDFFFFCFYPGPLATTVSITALPKAIQINKLIVNIALTTHHTWALCKYGTEFSQ